MAFDAPAAVEPIGVRQLLDTSPDPAAPRTGPRRFWTGREEMLLRATYPVSGIAGAMTELPDRSARAIYQHARELGLHAPNVTAPRRRWRSTEHIDAAIRRTYESPASGAVNRLAQTIGRPRSWIHDRAIKIGCAVPRFKALPWSASEIELLHAHAHKTPSVIERIFRAKGYARTATAIRVQIKRIGADTGDPNHYTARGLGLLMGVDAKTVTRWIEKGMLSASRRETARVTAQGGDEWWISRQQVRRFVIENVAAVDFRKVDKVWLVELLTGRANA